VEGDRGWLSWSNLGGLSGDEVDAVVKGEIARFRELGIIEKFEWKLYGRDRPEDLRERLVAHGFAPKEPADAILVLDLNELPQEFRGTRGHEVRKIAADEAGLEEIRKIMQAVWPEEDATDTIGFIRESIAIGPEANSLYLAYVDGKPVAEGRIDFGCGEFAGIWGGATLPAYRNRGIYTALVAARASEAIERGIRFLTIDASPMSRSVLEKRGFRFFDTALECNFRGV
jgi:predicted GNAT family acetyltransferase